MFLFNHIKQSAILEIVVSEYLGFSRNKYFFAKDHNPASNYKISRQLLKPARFEKNYPLDFRAVSDFEKIKPVFLNIED